MDGYSLCAGLIRKIRLVYLRYVGEGEVTNLEAIRFRIGGGVGVEFSD